MNRQMLSVLQRRSELLAEITAQRGEMAEIGARWEAPLTLADRGLAVVRFLRSHPVLIAGAAALFMIRRRGAAGLMKGGWRIWRGYRYLTALSEKLF